MNRHRTRQTPRLTPLKPLQLTISYASMRLHLLYLLLTCATGIIADLSMDSFVSIQAPPTVQAGVPFNATINVDW
jgi:hypothetical protein